MRRPCLTMLFLACVTGIGCEGGAVVETASPLPAPIAVPTPAGTGSAEPNLSTGVDGSVLMSWVEPSD
ncbi:MAG: hypothetical protein ACYC28_15680, partial [Longimicrobiales bacterium]